MTRTVLVAGTASHVGKSTVAAGLCRLLADRGVDVAPFKAQNMSNNARAVPKAGEKADGGPEWVGTDESGTDEARTDEARTNEVGTDDPETDEAATDDPGTATAFGEIGVSQYVQARAAQVRPTTDHNPVLLKPRGDGESQLVFDGEAVAHYEASEYYDRYWDRARETARRAHDRLAREHEMIVAEGAGSIAEINLHHRDLANLETARFADADVLLVADVDRGGVFASVLGTLELLPEDVRERVAGVAITKFRGDQSILDPGLEELEARTGVPVLGVLPYDDPGLPAEDSVDLPAEDERATRGEDGIPEERAVTVAVPRLPRISNFTDLEPLAAEPGVRVSYRPLDADYGDADAVVIPGTKNSVDDLLAAREAGLDREIERFDGPVVGLCGGYQLLGERITGADVEGTGDREVVEGFGVLPVETAFSPDKRVRPVTLDLDGAGPLAGASGPVEGYEIHMGETRATGDVETPFAPAETNGDASRGASAALGAAHGTVLGTYLHGLFENEAARRAFVEAAFDAAGTEPPATADRERSPYDRAARLVEEHVDLGPLELDGS